MTTLTELARALIAAGDLASELNIEILRDAVWMATLVSLEERDELAAPDATEQLAEDTQSVPESISEGIEAAPNPSAGPAKPAAHDQNDTTVGVSPTVPTGQGDVPTIAAAVAHLPAPAPLSDALAVSRALRPFRRATKPGRRQSLDIEATIRATAEANGLLQPVMRRIPEPQFMAHVVVDSASTMAVWAEPLGALVDAIRRANVFSSVQEWKLAASEGLPAVRRTTGQRPSTTSPPWTLASSDDVVFLATEARESTWRSGPWRRAVASWGRHALLALVNPLPPRWWSRTALPPHTVRIRAEPGAATNLVLSARPSRRRLPPESDITMLPLPVLTLTATDVQAWSYTVVNAHPDGSLGILLTDDKTAWPERTATGADAVAGFRRLSSAQAWRLAVMLSASERHTLATMHLTQEFLVSESSTADLAQVLASGIIREYSPGKYSFDRAARRTLHTELPAYDAFRVFRCIWGRLKDSDGVDTIHVLLEDPARVERLPEQLSVLADAALSALHASRATGAAHLVSEPDNRSETATSSPQPLRTQAASASPIRKEYAPGLSSEQASINPVLATSLPESGPCARILDPTGRTVGVGVFVGSREIVTCAHVVNAALGLDPRTQDKPAGEITVESALLPTGDGAPLRARVARWLPPPRPGAAGDDIAGLVLTSAELPTGASPARLIANLPRPGQVVAVFGYPGSPPRPDGAWVEATVRGEVGGGRLQLDSTTDTALRIQPGFSGSPVFDRGTGRVIGLLATAPPAGSGERDSYAITADRLRLTWPEVLDPRYTPTRRQATGAAEKLTVLHVSDPQFGRRHLFGGNGLTKADQAHDALFRRLHDDLDALAENPGLRPDLMVVTGDLAEWGLPREFEQVVQFLTALTEAVQLPRRHVALVPGNHDVNRKTCEAYFLDQSGEECDPVPPYWPKWKHFAAAFERFYEGVDGVSFTPDEPWTLFEMPDLAVVVAGLNSTMAESHRDADHYGWVGEHQLRWFAERLAGYRERGWLRLAAVHHNAVRGAVADDENLRDAEDLDQRLGQPGLVNLLLHGHTHDGRLHRLPSGLLALSTGSAAVTAEARPHEVPNQYQLLTISPHGVTRHARQYAAGQRRWIGDTRVSHDDSDWRHHEPGPLRDVTATFSRQQPDTEERHGGERVARPGREGPVPGDSFFDRVLEATQVSHPGATVTPRPEDSYLRVSKPLPDGGAEQWPVGVVEGEATDEHLTSFTHRVHRQFASADPSVRSELVYSGSPAAKNLITEARRQGVRLRSFVDYQGLLDLRELAQRQAAELAADPIYPPQLYVPQRYRQLDDDPDDAARDDLLGQVVSWLGAQGARFVMLLGDFGRGKTFLLRELARTLPGQLPGLLPVLVELRNLEKAPTLDELLAQHLVRQNVTEFDVTKLRYMIRSGRLALLFDGFDELELRVGFDNAADYLTILMRAVTDRAKVVLTSRTQHFRSTAQLRTALGDQVAALSASRVAVLADFTDEQILQFLANHYGGDHAAAQARFDLLGDVHDLLGLSRNPRMLSFIADLDEARLRAVQAEHGQISAAELYRELVDFWLVREADRQHHRTGRLRSLDEKERLVACTALALRLWTTTATTIPVTDLTTEVSTRLTRLAERGYTADQAAHTVGSGTLLVRTPEGEFTFVHQSVMEWLVANSAAEKLQEGTTADNLASRRMSTLMLDFFCDLAGHEVALRWADDVRGNPAASEAAKQNGWAITQRLGPVARQKPG